MESLMLQYSTHDSRLLTRMAVRNQRRSREELCVQQYWHRETRRTTTSLFINYQWAPAFILFDWSRIDNLMESGVLTGKHHQNGRE